MKNEYLLVNQSLNLSGTVELSGAKNSVLVIMASLILTSGTSKLFNVPFSSDVYCMIDLLRSLGALVNIDTQNCSLQVDTSSINKFEISPQIMNKMRASVLVMGPLLSRFGKAKLFLPGGCSIGSRPIDYHLKAFSKMSAKIEQIEGCITASVENLKSQRFILDYPSVGATENIIMATVLSSGITEVVNAALEPEVLDLITVLKKMGADISVQAPATLVISGVNFLKPISHFIMFDRLEAGTLLLAAAITGGQIYLPQAQAYFLDTFLEKLRQMGHEVKVGLNGIGISLKATKYPQAVSIKTMPYPGFPTDLQAPMMAALCFASGTSTVEELVFENRLLHVNELKKMGADIQVKNNREVRITGVKKLYGTEVKAWDIRSAVALALAGLKAEGATTITEIHHFFRGYCELDKKISRLGGSILVKN